VGRNSTKYSRNPYQFCHSRARHGNLEQKVDPRVKPEDDKRRISHHAPYYKIQQSFTDSQKYSTIAK